MRYQERFPAKEFLDELMSPTGPRVRARVAALAQRMAAEGHLPREHGHWLKGPYSELFEFKSLDYRVFAFLLGRRMYLTNAAKKTSPRKQERDYKIAMIMRAAMLAREPK